MSFHILFDFFGTLVEYSASRTQQGYERSHRLLSQAGSDLSYQRFLDQWSAHCDEFEREAEASTIEFSMTDLAGPFLVRVLPSPPTASFISEFADLYVSEWNKGVQYPPGISELLGRLATCFDLAVITNTHDPALVPGHLARMGVAGHFKTVVTSVEYGRRKPNPAIFTHTLELLGVASENCIYVGDNFKTDYLGARAAGIRAMLIDPSKKHPVPEGERLDSIFQLPKLLPTVA